MNPARFWIGVLLLAALPCTVWGIVPLGTEFQVNTYTAGTQIVWDVASAAGGDFVVVWVSGSYGGYTVLGQRYDSAALPLGSEFQVNAYTTGSHNAPSVAADALGDFVVAWHSDQGGSYNNVFGRRFDSTGAPLGTEFKVNSFPNYGGAVPSVASGAGGNFVVVWLSLHDDLFGVFAQRYDSAGGALGGEFQVNTYTEGGALMQAASVSADADGDFVVVWQSLPLGNSYGQDGDEAGVFGQRFGSAGNSLGTEFQVNSYTTSFQTPMGVSSDPSGNFVVVWKSYNQDGDSYGVFARRYDSTGAPLAAEFQVNSYTTSYQGVGSVAADANGNFTVVWRSVPSAYSIIPGQDGDGAGVFGQRYDGAGMPVGSEFQVNTYTTSYQSFPAASVDDAGNLVVVWSSYTQDGSEWGVFGQRLATPAECAPGPAPCDDGNVCNGIETCDPSGACVKHPAPVCDDGDFCNGQESCDPHVGCQPGAPPTCDDGDVCNGTETCDPSAGCVKHPVQICNDGDPCTKDSCDPSSGCKYEPVPLNPTSLQSIICLVRGLLPTR